MRPWNRRAGRDARTRIERDVEDEILGHIEMKARDLERQGLSGTEARAAAAAAFGSTDGIARECAAIQREMHVRRNRTMWFDEIGGDVRWALRSMIRARWFTVFAVLTLALGVAANTSIFSIANGLLFRSLPGVQDPGTLVDVSRGPGYVSVSHPMYEHFRDEAPGVSGLAAFDLVGLSIDAGDGAPAVVLGLQVSGNYFDVLGTRPALGRFFDGAERDPAAGVAVAVLSHRQWQELGASPGVVGSSIRLNGVPVTVIGVAEPGFSGHIAPAEARIFMPLGSPLPGFHPAESLADMNTSVLELVARLSPGTNRETLEARLTQIARARLPEDDPAATQYLARVQAWAPVPGSMRGPAKAFFAVLSVLVGLLLLIACLNVAGLLISRSERRRREIAIRMSLGASRSRLVRQLIVEALAMSALAGLAGVLLTYWITGALNAFQLPVAPLPGLRLDLRLGPDGLVMLYSVLVVLVTGVLFGLAPALKATRPDLVTDLRVGTGARRPSGARFQDFLVGAQMAGTIVLLTGSGLFLRALVAAESLDPGFDTADVHVASFDLELAGRSAEESWTFYDELRRRALLVPGVEHASVAGKLPLSGLSQMAPVNFEGVTPPPETEGFTLANQSVGADYFTTLGIPVLEGRGIAETDIAAAQPVVVVNRVLADRMWPGESALGKSVTTDIGGLPYAWQVVGVVATAKYNRANEEARPFAYFAASQRPRTDMILHVKMAPGAPAPFREIRDIAARLEPAAATLSAGSLESAVAIFLLPQRVGAWVTGVVGLFGLLLGILGTYALTAYRVAGHARELGVRMALGATAASVLGGVLRKGMVAPLIGGLIGLATALAAGRLMDSFLFGVQPLDPVVFGGVIVVLMIAAGAANLLPAARAARLDPARVLRTD